MILLAIDPGETTGICVADTPSDSHNRTFQVVLAAQIPWDRRLVDLRALVAGTFHEGLPRPDTIVIEAFRLRPGRAMEQVGSVFPSVRIIGIVEAFVYVLHPTVHIPIVYQEPSIMSRVQVPDDYDELFVGQTHARDAFKHARYFITTKGE